VHAFDDFNDVQIQMLNPLLAAPTTLVRHFGVKFGEIWVETLSVTHARPGKLSRIANFRFSMRSDV